MNVPDQNLDHDLNRVPDLFPNTRNTYRILDIIPNLDLVPDHETVPTLNLTTDLDPMPENHLKDPNLAPKNRVNDPDLMLKNHAVDPDHINPDHVANPDHINPDHVANLDHINPDLTVNDVTDLMVVDIVDAEIAEDYMMLDLIAVQTAVVIKT